MTNESDNSFFAPKKKTTPLPLPDEIPVINEQPPAASFRDFIQEEHSDMDAAAADQLLSFIRKFDDKVADGSKCFVDVNGVPYLTQVGIHSIRLFRSHLKAVSELANHLAPMPANTKAVAENIVVHSGGSRESIVLDKMTAIDAVTKEYQERNSKSPHSLIYFGSADDIEPVLLSPATEIALVDPYLGEAEAAKMIERIKTYAEVASTDGKEKSFDVKLKSGEIKKVLIYPLTMEDFQSQYPDEKFDIVFLFNKNPGMKTTDAARSVATDGVLFDNRKD